VQPHAHYLGRRMEAEARLPNGTVTPIIQIADWDFRWQDVFVFEQPLRLPKGTSIAMRFEYDNSAANPRNPFQPPRRIVWGQDSSDEMGDLWLQLVAVARDDTARLVADVERKTRTEDLAGYRKVLAADPSNPLRHDAVALLLLQDGRAEEAAQVFRDSLRLNPASAPTRYNLGLALAMTRQFDAARAEFRAAIALDPQHAGALNNLGALEHVAGRLDEAMTFYRRSLGLQPENVEARTNLARVLMTVGRFAEAAADFSTALRMNPDYVSALSGLAWVRAVSPDSAVRRPDEAVRLGLRAVALAGRGDPSLLDALAAAYAAASQFEAAATTAQEAAALADRLGMRTLGQEVRQRAQLYAQLRPYVAR
jgi:tetratricopeptide (TPR) repeat protein